MLAAPKKIKSYRASETAERLLEALTADMGLTQSAVIELALRDLYARRFRGRKPPKSAKNPPEET